MNLKKRMLAAGIILVVFLGFLYAAHVGSLTQEQVANVLHSAKETVRVWYTDEALTDYMNSAAVEFQEKSGIRVIPVLVSGLEYLDAIQKASMEEKELPDLYVTTNDTLEKAYLAGLASEIQDKGEFCSTINFPKAAMEAVTYKNRLVGYPFYYETSVLLYNKTYVDDVTKTSIESEADIAEAEAAEAALEEALEENAPREILDAVPETQEGQAEVTEELIEERRDTVIPKTIDDILIFANGYDAPEEVEAVFKWDVSDIFYNYFMVGNYLRVGGVNGDDVSDIDIYNKDTIACLLVYQNLNQFFSIDPDEVNYDTVLQDFMDGKIVYTVATTDAIGKIEEAKAEGKFQYEYGVSTLPDINDSLKTRSLSVTNAVVVNGYSEKKACANEFAAFLTGNKANDLYGQSGKVSSNLGVAYENPEVAHVMEEYKDSIPMPKMIETSNYWMQLEIAFTKIWTGEDVNAQLKQLSEQIMTQVTGAPFEEEPIENPPVAEVAETEY